MLITPIITNSYDLAHTLLNYVTASSEYAFYHHPLIDKENRHEKVPGDICMFWNIYFLDVSTGKCLPDNWRFSTGSRFKSCDSSPSRLQSLRLVLLG